MVVTPPPPPPPPQELRRRARSPLGAAVLGWIVPGLGQVYAGRPRKGLLYFLVLVPLFVLGLALTHFTVIDPERFGLDFGAQALLGGPTAAAWWSSRGHVLQELPRFFDTGRLYVQVAGLLNLVAIGDAVGEVIRHNRRVDALGAHEAEVAARRDLEGEAAAAAEVAEVAEVAEAEQTPPADSLGEEIA